MTTATAVETPSGSDLRRDLGLLLWQIRYEQRAFWRNRTRAVFTFAFPIMFLVVFASIDKGAHLTVSGHRIPYDDFFVPGILAYGVITTTYGNMAISTAILRDEGVLKRMQGTPLPRWAYVAGRLGSTVVLVLAMTATTLALGAILYGVQVRASTLPGLIATLAIGTLTFTTLGVGLVRFIKTAESAPVITNLTILPLTFISSIWFSTAGMPKTLRSIASFFPLRPLADALQYAFNPFTTGAGIKGGDIGSLAIWAVVGTWLMFRFLQRPAGEDV
jgi:ABC-2 type transport system permease protein